MRRTLTLVLAASVVALAAPSARATFPGANGDIAFSRDTKGQSDVWVVDAASTGTTRLTRTPRRNEGLVDWNATGTRLAFSRCGRAPLSNCDIWTIDADGTDPTRITFTPAPIQETWPSWSPDGTRIAFTSNAADDAQDVWVMDADGGDPTRLTATLGFDAFPEWSPDGGTIAFTSDRMALDDIWLMDPDGGDLRRLTRGPKIDERPDWSPDASRLTFSRNGDIWAIDADGSDAVRLTTSPRHEFGSTYAPNGRRIAYDREDRRGRVGIWVMRPDGSNRRQLTFGRFDAFPDWAPA